MLSRLGGLEEIEQTLVGVIDCHHLPIQRFGALWIAQQVMGEGDIELVTQLSRIHIGGELKLLECLGVAALPAQRYPPGVDGIGELWVCLQSPLELFQGLVKILLPQITDAHFIELFGGADVGEEVEQLGVRLIQRDNALKHQVG